MRTRTVVGYALFAALLAGLAPAPAEAQLGKFLKKKLKEAVVQTAVDAVAPDSSGDGGSGPIASAGSSRARKGTGEQLGPVFSENLLEITPDLLDRLERGLAAEAKERSLEAEVVKKMLPRTEYVLCQQQMLNNSPEGRKAYEAYIESLKAAKAAGGDTQAAMKAGRKMMEQVEALTLTRCGPDPSHAESLRRGNWDKILGAGLAAFGLVDGQPGGRELFESQYALLKERVAPFCAAADAAQALASGLVYTKGEMDAMRPRCAKLASLLKG